MLTWQSTKFAQQPSILEKWSTHNILLGDAACAWEVSQTLCLISFKHTDQDFWLPSSDSLLFSSCNTWMWWYTINEKWRYEGAPWNKNVWFSLYKSQKWVWTGSPHVAHSDWGTLNANSHLAVALMLFSNREVQYCCHLDKSFTPNKFTNLSK